MRLASLGAGFESFMLLLFNNLLRDSIYGMVMRVGIGAFLSLVDAGTDISVLISYYSAGLTTQANILLAMIMSNMVVQCIIVLFVYAKKSWRRKLYEVVITLTFLRPPIDAYRVSTNQSDDELTVNPLSEMVSDQRREPQPAHRSPQLIQTQPNLPRCSIRLQKSHARASPAACCNAGYSWETVNRQDFLRLCQF